MIASRIAKRAGLVAGALLLGWLGPAGRAEAQEFQKITAITAGAVFGAVDVFFIAYDLTLAERNVAPSRTMALVEVTVTTLQLASGISMFLTGLQPDSRLAAIGVDRDLYLPIGGLLAVMAAPLFAHGTRHATTRVGGGMHTLRVVPTRVGDAHAGGPGLVLAGVF
jgi:hypothetical protein